MSKSRRKTNKRSAGQGGRRVSKKVRGTSPQTPEAVEKAESEAVGTVGDASAAVTLAETYLSQKRYAEAEETATEGLTLAPDSSDLYYVLCLAQGAMADFESAREAGENYLTLMESVTPAARERRTAVLNQLGLACLNRQQTDTAETWFAQAIESAPSDPRAYLNLVHHYRQNKMLDKADAIIELGLKSCSQVQELRLLKSAFARRQTISACLMVKNEEELLGGCLDSIRDWVDEIIVVDTGSTDRTVEIAQSYGAKIFHQPWEGNFSKHRNYSMEQATSDWIFIIDADEQIYTEDVPDLYPFLENPKIKAISLNVLNVYGDKEQKQVFLLSPRFFRRELNVRYSGIVHNQVNFPDDTPALRTGVRLKHFGYDLSPEKMEQKVQRSRQLLEKQLAENPDNAFARFNLAQLLRAGSEECPEERGPEIIRLASRAVELTSPDKLGERHIHLMCLDQLAWTHFYLGQYEEALAYCHRALEHKSDFLDPLLLIGHIYMRQERFDDCRKAYNIYLEAQAAYNPDRETDEIIIQHIDSRTVVYCNLGLLAYSQKKTDEARDWLEKTTKLDPDFPTANGWLGRIYLDENDLDRAEQYLLKHLEVSDAITDEPLLLARLYLTRNNRENAEKFLLQAHEIDPSDMSVILKLGRLYAETDRDAQAMEFFGRAMQEVGDDVESCRHLAETFGQLGRHEEAIDLYQRLVRDGHESAQVLNDLGNSYFQIKRYVDAENCYLKALSFDFAPAVTHRNLGVVQVEYFDRKHEAIASLEQYLKIHPDDGPIWRLVGDIYSQIQDYPLALERYEKYLSFNPGDKMAVFNLSECYLNMGHADSAILGYQKALEIDPGFDLAQQRLLQLSESAGKV